MAIMVARGLAVLGWLAVRAYARGLGWGLGFGTGAMAVAWAVRRLLDAGYIP